MCIIYINTEKKKLNSSTFASMGNKGSVVWQNWVFVSLNTTKLRLHKDQDDKELFNHVFYSGPLPQTACSAFL